METWYGVTHGLAGLVLLGSLGAFLAGVTIIGVLLLLGCLAVQSGGFLVMHARFGSQAVRDFASAQRGRSVFRGLQSDRWVPRANAMIALGLGIAGAAVIALRTTGVTTAILVLSAVITAVVAFRQYRRG